MPTLEMPVAELMGAFLDGLRALVPAFNRAHLGWREDDSYDPWDDTATALFKALVGSAVENGVYDSPILSLRPYNTRPLSEFSHSYITEVGTNALSVFVHFETDEEPFDTCLFAWLDNDGGARKPYRKKVAETKFALVPRCKDGTLKAETLALTFKN